MRFNEHSRQAGQHAFLSPSAYHWVNYSTEKLRERYRTARAAAIGSSLHAYAAEAIELREWQMNDEETLGMFINDCIREGMTPEQVLYYSDNAFGTADAIRFALNKLQVWDLKTGASKTSEHQLEVYVALFCLEYGIDPYDIDEIELRIYQGDEVRMYDVDPKYIWYIMGKIVEFDVQLTELRLEEQP